MITALASLVVAQAPESPDYLLSILREIGDLLGPIGLLIVIGWFIWTKYGQGKRAERGEPAPNPGGYAAQRILLDMMERSDTHLKENTAVARDTAFSVERLTAAMEQSSQITREQMRDIHESQRRTESTIETILREMRRE